MTVTRLPTYVDEEAPPGTIGAMALCDRAALTYRRVDYWTRSGLLTPLPRPPHATTGTNRYYPLPELHRAATLGWLLDGGLSLQTCRQIIDDLMATGSARLANGLTIHLPEEP